MIDTDKYEGHTEGPWVWSSLNDEELIMFDADAYASGFPNIILRAKEDDADAQLIADAPLLLAEAKRLREKLESIQNSMAWTVQVWWNENYMGREGWMEQMCEVYADLAKGIEAQYHGEEEE